MESPWLPIADNPASEIGWYAVQHRRGRDLTYGVHRWNGEEWQAGKPWPSIPPIVARSRKIFDSKGEAKAWVERRPWPIPAKDIQATKY